MGKKLKTTINLTEEDWIKIHKKGQQYESVKEKEIETFLEVGYLHQTTTHYQTGQYEKNLICMILKEFLRKKGITLRHTLKASKDVLSSATYENIEYEEDKYKSCLTEGLLLGKNKGGIRYTFYLYSFGEYWSISICSHKKHQHHIAQLLEELKKYAKEHNFYKNKKIEPNCSFIKFDKRYTWDDIVLPTKVKKEIKTNISNLLDNTEIFKINNLNMRRGLIFKGIPGIGKTLMAKILANATKCTFILVTPKYLQKASAVASIVQMARDLAPTILLLEDIDLYGASRNRNINKSLLGELMNQLDGVIGNEGVITIATSNNPEDIEMALRNRPGRFDKVIEFKPPEKEYRMQMLQKFTKGLSIAKGVNLTAFADKTNGLTGAHMRELINMAIIKAVEEKSYDSNKKVILKEEHLQFALSEAKLKKFTVGFRIESEDEAEPEEGEDF